MSSTALTILALLGGSIAGVLSLTLVLWLAPRARHDLRAAAHETLAEPRHFTFRDGYLIENSENVGFLLSTPIDHLKAWSELIDVLGDIADGVEQAFRDLRDAGRSFRLDGVLGRDRISIMGVRQDEDIRITVSASETAQTTLRVDLASLEALQADTDLLTRSSDTTPTLSWVVDGTGRVIWANAAYCTLAERCAGPDALRGWPMVSLFPEQAGAPAGVTRRQVIDSKGETSWYEITSQPADPSGMRHVHAISLDAVIAAEDNLRTFIQTLTKTFAYLPTGLAIFDREKSLAMFNPALMDMTGLDASWLSRRPKLTDFFDALRDHRKLPEPRDYKAWRDGLSDLSRVDAGGTYRETWTLPTGQTYCVTGRPQADGAVALMLEDISADVHASRAHRDERDALRAALSAADEAIIVFSASGTCVGVNDQARDLLKLSQDGIPDTLDACLVAWRDLFRPSPAWGDLRGVVAGDLQDGDLVDWTETLVDHDGRTITLRVIPGKTGGLTLCFRPTDLPNQDTAPTDRPATTIAAPGTERVEQAVL
ncbi:diguanylate cyclase [Jannaschia pagri]|uniref:Diguanylate cyclase n=1 Tax=Jannaschia pagri TaxID=2829797 RepID=A0ABQ4NQB8_9RHOB|nr:MULTISPECIES: PAS-domain containing protein [unclassified Jannaschia]GIT92553.1 diguanylate cyclase [Jannaschia sp. AI_61]GIT96587.1 diguanylate cyclase [Jannaschia sp. AI_62]